MKIKQEFVTNSSSESFVVMGIFLEEDEIKDCVDKLIEKGHANIGIASFDTKLELILDKSDLEYSFGGDYGGSYAAIGIHYTKMKDDETLKQFKDRIQHAIQHHFGVKKAPGHIEMAWENR